MGNQTLAPIKKDKKEQIQELILNMKLTAKQYEIGAQKNKLKQQQIMENAKNALRTNNEDICRIQIRKAINKSRESEKYMHLANKIESYSNIIQSNTSNQQLMETLLELAPILADQSKFMDFNAMELNTDDYEYALHKLALAGKINDYLTNPRYHDESIEILVQLLLFLYLI